jgi:hypothetical protein
VDNGSAMPPKIPKKAPGSDTKAISRVKIVAPAVDEDLEQIKLAVKSHVNHEVPPPEPKALQRQTTVNRRETCRG